MEYTDGEWIFQYLEADGSTLNVAPMSRKLWFKSQNSTGSATVSVDVNRQSVRRLYDALGAWLNVNDLPPATPYTATPAAEAIRAMCREEFERLFEERKPDLTTPLHESPQARYVDANPAPGLLGATLADSDPEPHDVGHPEPTPLERVREFYCGTLAPDVAEHGRLMAELPKRQRPGTCVSCGMPWPHVGAHPLYLCECGHCSRQHAGSYGYAECGVAGCECESFKR